MLSNLLRAAKPRCKHGKLFKQVEQKWDLQLLLWKSALRQFIPVHVSFKASAGENGEGNHRVMSWSLFETGLYTSLEAAVLILLFRLEVGI